MTPMPSASAIGMSSPSTVRCLRLYSIWSAMMGDLLCSFDSYWACVQTHAG
ncbi:MAG: hypothetical protein K8E66_10675 [Phycisphaerales bacterium]|nr:hypothetical protein [Phycisphaerales bacterium]